MNRKSFLIFSLALSALAVPAWGQTPKRQVTTFESGLYTLTAVETGIVAIAWVGGAAGSRPAQASVRYFDATDRELAAGFGELAPGKPFVLELPPEDGEVVASRKLVRVEVRVEALTAEPGVPVVIFESLGPQHLAAFPKFSCAGPPASRVEPVTQGRCPDLQVLIQR